MSSHTVVQLVTLLVYAILIVVVVRYAQPRLKNLFIVYLTASAGWSLTSFMSNFGLPLEANTTQLQYKQEPSL